MTTTQDEFAGRSGSALSEGLGLVERLQQRTLPEHGGKADSWAHHWNLTHGDSAMHAEAAGEIERLAKQAAFNFSACVEAQDLGANYAYEAAELRRLLQAAEVLFAPLCRDATARNWLDEARAALSKEGGPNVRAKPTTEAADGT